MSGDTVSVTYVGPCSEVITRRGVTFVQGEPQNLPREYASKLSGDYEIDGVPLTGTGVRTSAAEKLAKENGIDLNSLVGTGKSGNVTKGDVQEAIDAQEDNGGS